VRRRLYTRRGLTDQDNGRRRLGGDPPLRVEPIEPTGERHHVGAQRVNRRAQLGNDPIALRVSATNRNPSEISGKDVARTLQLSGGEAQRIAIARALSNDPRIILADEPTAALDSQRAGIVMDLLRKVAAERRTAVIVVTHDEKIFDRFDHIYALRDGALEAPIRAAE
jgi:ABC-type glutathione transport system ATPase component